MRQRELQSLAHHPEGVGVIGGELLCFQLPTSEMLSGAWVLLPGRNLGKIKAFAASSCSSAAY